MKAPDHRPKFHPTNRHYHRFRAETRDDWSVWIDTPGKFRRLRKGGSRIRLWLVTGLLASAAVGLICWGTL